MYSGKRHANEKLIQAKKYIHIQLDLNNERKMKPWGNFTM